MAAISTRSPIAELRVRRRGSGNIRSPFGYFDQAYHKKSVLGFHGEASFVVLTADPIAWFATRCRLRSPSKVDRLLVGHRVQAGATLTRIMWYECGGK